MNHVCPEEIVTTERWVPLVSDMTQGYCVFRLVKLAVAKGPFAYVTQVKSHRYRVVKKTRGSSEIYLVNYQDPKTCRWEYIGKFDPAAKSPDGKDALILTKGSVMGDDDTPVRLFRWIAARAIWDPSREHLPKDIACQIEACRP